MSFKIHTLLHTRTHARTHARTQSRTHARTHARTHSTTSFLRFCATSSKHYTLKRIYDSAHQVFATSHTAPDPLTPRKVWHLVPSNTGSGNLPLSITFHPSYDQYSQAINRDIRRLKSQSEVFCIFTSPWIVSASSL